MRAFMTLALLTAASTAHADVANEVTYGGFARALRAPSADATTADPLGGGIISYARALDVPLGDRLQLWAETGMMFAGASGEMFQTMDTKINSFTFTAGARIRYALVSHIDVGARLDLGVARTALDLTEGSTKLTDSAWGAVAVAAADVDLYAYASKRFSLGVRFEIGYTKTQAVQLTMHREGDDDGTIKLPVMDASFGHLDLSGPSIGGALIGQF